EVRSQGGRGQGQGARFGARERHHGHPGLRAFDQGHRGRHTAATQRLSPAQEAARLNSGRFAPGKGWREPAVGGDRDASYLDLDPAAGSEMIARYANATTA